MAIPTIRPAMIAAAYVKSPSIFFESIMVAIMTITPLMYVPMLRAAAGFPPSLPLTSMMPITDAKIPIAAIISGNIAAVISVKVAEAFDVSTATAARVIAEIIEPT